MTKTFFGIAFTIICMQTQAQLVPLQREQKTYCNPINIDYSHKPIPGATKWGRHRATADPVIVTYKGDYYLFCTNQKGY